MNLTRAKILELEETIEDIKTGKEIKLTSPYLRNITMERYYYELFNLYQNENETRN